MQVLIVDRIPPLYSVFDLKSRARAKLVDRSGSMVINEIGKHRSDWIKWSEVELRTPERTGICTKDSALFDQAIFYSEMDWTGRV